MKAGVARIGVESRNCHRQRQRKRWIEDGGWTIEDGGWRIDDGGLRIEDGG